ncbi:hypothetical protein [Streptomyces marianii]|uniref:Uncharacterized protein n=1 Tax=Streptomyces marianii TaxID=1817406 RepID=A0A5R9EJR9_9ACTN|nr:hypothetical protein [Streptomyces marianii]TLQ47904.1 hypothetical protein FEF34_37835 [Streptomyces marianii]
MQGPEGDLLAVLRGGPDEPVWLFNPFQITARKSELFPTDALQAGEVVGRLPTQGQRLVALAAPGGASVAGIVTDDAIEVWDTSRPEPQHIGTYPASPRAMFAGIPSPDKAWKVAITGDEGIQLHGPRPAVQRGSRPSPSPRPRQAAKPQRVARAAHLMAALPSATGTQRLAVPTGSQVEILDVATGQCLDHYEQFSPVTFLEALPIRGGSAAVAVATPRASVCGTPEMMSPGH